MFPKQFLHVLGAMLYIILRYRREHTIIDTLVYFVFNNVSGQSLVGKTINPIFFHLCLGVRRMGKQFILF